MSVIDRLSQLLGRAEPDPQADPAVMRAIGTTVRERLLADPRVEPRGGGKADLFLMRGLLTQQQCRKLIAVIDSRIQPSVLFSDKASPRGRTSSTHFFAKDMPETKALARKIGAVTGIAPVHAEPLQGQRYREGEEYRHHRDHFRPDRPHWQVERRRGGQRSWTAMAFLNKVAEGGHTHFSEIGASIEPKPGVLLIWNNARPDGSPNEDTLHAGTPVISGEKYVLTKWYRTRKWT